MTLKFMSFSSGSNGNCYFLTDGRNGLLIDAGVSIKKLKKELFIKGFGLDAFQAVLITHDHFDHIKHLGSFCKHLKRPVYTTEGLHKALSEHSTTKEWIGSCRRILPEGEATTILLRPNMEPEACPRITHFYVPHDATQTVGYFIEWGDKKFFLMTDAGRVTEEAIEYARMADAVVFESNYDTGMLIGGPYPHELKMRICKGSGHLSNEECSVAVHRFWHPGLKHIFLCHLSENNNTPALAFEASAEALSTIKADNGFTAKETTDLQTLPRTTTSAVFTI